MASSIQERLEEELAKIDPAVLRYFDELLAENAPAVRKVVQNVLDEPISQEMQARLQKPLLPKTYEPRAPPRQRRLRRAQAILREYDPLYDDEEKEGREVTTGRRFIRWRFMKRLGRNLTPAFMVKIRERVSTSFYLRHVFAYQLLHIEDETIIVYYSNPKGSQWFDKLEDVEKWLNRQEEQRLNLEKTDRPNTKWVFENFFNVDVLEGCA